MSTKLLNKNSKGVLADSNGALTEIFSEDSPGAFCSPLPDRSDDAVTFPTDAVCPTCGSNLIAHGRIVYTYPFDDLMEAHVLTPTLVCPSSGCDFHFDRPAQPELPVKADDLD